VAKGQGAAALSFLLRLNFSGHRIFDPVFRETIY